MKEIQNKSFKTGKKIDSEYNYKIILLGDINTGKNILLNKIIKNNLSDNELQGPLSSDFQYKKVNINGKYVRLIFYNTAGQEQLILTLKPNYLKGADIIIILYNSSIYETFLNIEKNWIRGIKEVNIDPISVLVGNHIDFKSKKVVETKDGEALAAKYGLLFYEVSIKEEDSINKLFNNLIFPEMVKKFKIGKKENLQKYLNDKSINNKNSKIIDNKEKIDLNIIELQKQLNIEKNKNNNLLNKINLLEKELEEVKNKNMKLIEKINELENKSKDNNNRNDKKDVLEDLLEKDKEIKELKIKLSRYPFELNENENLISIIFTTLNEEIYYSIICKDTDDFNKLEKKLFEVFPEFNISDSKYFKNNGKKIDRYKTLIENNIKHNDIIIINFN